METQFNREFKVLLSKAPLREEYETTVMNSSAGAITQSILSATKEQVYEREFANLASLLGEEGENILNSRIAEAGLENATIDEKFEVLKQVASEISTKYHNLATAACGGKDFASIEAKYENSYKSAFGVDNDIMQRVSKYNRSQQTGAMAVKLTAVIGASFAGGYIGGAMAASAATAAAAAGTTAALSASTASTLGGAIGASAMTFLGEVTDDLTTTKALQAWADGDFKTLNECVDWAGIVKQTATAGIMMVGFGAVARGVQVLTVGLSPAAQGAAMFGANMAFGTGAEYVMTGKVSVQGVVLTGVFSIVAGVLQFHAANVTKAAEDAIKAQLQQDITNARNVLGIDDSVEVTAEMLKTLKRDFAVQLHPDKFKGSVATTASGHTLADVNAAIDLLQKNMAGSLVDVNAGVAAAQAAGSADDAGMALATAQTVDSGLEKAILSFARSAGVDKQVVTSTISKHPDVVNALVTRVASDGNPLFTNKDIALILGNSAEMLEKDKAMFMAVLNSEREMSIVASYDNRAIAFWKATLDPLDETYYAVRGGKSAQTSSAQNPLAEAGFTDDVIAAMKADAGEFYGVKLVDEALKTVEYLEKQVADGAKITRELVEEAIITCHPGGSGSSTSVVRRWIANNWRYGDEVYNAYGQRAPGQAALSKGNIKAKYNKVKHSIKETIEDIKFELGIDDAPKVESTSKGQQTSPARSEATTTSTVQTPSHASNEVIEQFVAARSTDDLARLVRNTSNVDDLEFIIRKLQSQDHVVNKQVIESITEDAINKRSILQGGPKEVEVSKGTGSYLKVYDDSGNLVSITRRSGSEVLSHIEYDAQGKMIEPYSLVEDGVVAATPTASTAPATPAKPVVAGELDLSAGMSYSNIDDFMVQCREYASQRGLTVEIGVRKGLVDSPVITFKDYSGQPVRELNYSGDELFDDTFTTYNSRGQVVNRTRYMADDGRLADNIQYFYDANGNTTYSTKMYSDGQMDVAIWRNGKGMRQGPGVFYTKAQAKARFGIDVDDSMIGTTSADAAAKLAKTGNATATSVESTPHTPKTPLIKKPATKAPVAEPTVPAAKPVRTQAEYKQALLSSEPQEVFYIKAFKEWADDMGLTMTIERTGKSRIALFRDSDGNLVRRITENDSEPGFVYDDRVNYFEDGKHVCGRVKYTDEPYMIRYDVDANGFATNRQKVYPQEASNTEAPADFASKLTTYKGPDGKQLLSQEEIVALLENCQDIPNYEAKIEAVLSNPEEVANIAGWNSRGGGVWRAIQAPLKSTVEANPAAFGVKPKPTAPTAPVEPAPVVKQSVPSQKLPRYIDRTVGDKTRAEAYTFGNGAIAEVNPRVADRAIKELSSYFGKELTADDVQVIRFAGDKPCISYFDAETNLTTVTSAEGSLNGQVKIIFDEQGNITDFQIYSIYFHEEGKFYLR